METLSFTFFIDLPLFLMAAGLLVWYFHYWSHNTDLDSSADLVGRLPTASTKAVVLLGMLCFVCWAANFPFWGMFAVLLILGMVVSIAVGGELDGLSLIHI